MTELNVAAAPWRAGVIQDFARSELFDRTFEEGMTLVEETAAYLDGAGRHDSKILSRNAALAYASESMRLTTRLMQVASWLLVQRAVKEGEMAAEAACADNYRLGLEAGEPAPVEDLPFGLVNLLQRSERLYERVRHLDKRMYVEAGTEEAPRPVQAHFDRLSAAFGAA
uniref:Regulator of CtrA degradation rcdA n=1 Tax=Caulobacter sp. (strain K31) TaxID=366602 RepID=B0SVK7_CAUSK